MGEEPRTLQGFFAHAVWDHEDAKRVVAEMFVKNQQQGGARAGRTHTLRRNSQDFREIVWISAGHSPTHGDALFIRNLLQQAD
jgi:hypothetical protein